jgi:hypothetical protein
MTEPDSFSEVIYEEQATLAERELYSFIAAVTALYGPEQGKLSGEDWLAESELIDSPPRSEDRNWRAVTIAASVRLADRVHTQNPGGKSAPDPKVSPIPSCNCEHATSLVGCVPGRIEKPLS